MPTLGLGKNDGRHRHAWQVFIGTQFRVTSSALFCRLQGSRQAFLVSIGVGWEDRNPISPHGQVRAAALLDGHGRTESRTHIQLGTLESGGMCHHSEAAPLDPERDLTTFLIGTV